METLSSVVGGEHTTDADHEFEVRNPADGATLATVRSAMPGDIDAAVAAAARTFQTTRRSGLAERVGWCNAVADAIAAQRGSLAHELSEEHGKTSTEAAAEITAGERGFRLAGECARNLNGENIPVEDPNKRVVVVHEPRGVWALLSPWNFPFNIPIEYLGPALATGSPVVWKPAPTCVRIASRLVDIMLGAGVPAGMINLALTDDVAVAQHLVTHDGIDAVAVTGGTATGAAIARAAWRKHLLLELGGNGPVVVLDDADIDAAAAAAANGAFSNAGQVCSAAGRILVAESVADEFVAKVAAHAAAIRVGDPRNADTMMGPVHLESVVATMDRHIADAVARGAEVVAGGSRVAGAPTPLYYLPTVLDHVSADAEVMRTETFGPIAPVMHCSSDEELLAYANSGDRGLVAAVYTQSLSRAWRFAEQLETGSVVVNDTSNYWELHMPFGGSPRKDSGRGRLGGMSAIRSFTETKTISFDIA